MLSLAFGEVSKSVDFEDSSQHISSPLQGILSWRQSVTVKFKAFRWRFKRVVLKPNESLFQNTWSAKRFNEIALKLKIIQIKANAQNCECRKKMRNEQEYSTKIMKTMRKLGAKKQRHPMNNRRRSGIRSLLRPTACHNCALAKAA